MPWCHECETEYEQGYTRCADCGAELFEDMPPALTDPAKADWGPDGGQEPEWPLDDRGELTPPAFLTKVSGTQIDYDMQTGLLRAFGVPVQTDLPNAGQLARILFGFSGAGMDIYVPETMLDLARELLGLPPV